MSTAEDIIYLAGVPEDFKDKYVKMINELVESKCKEAVDKYKANLALSRWPKIIIKSSLPKI